MREIVRWASSTVWSGKVLQCDLRKASVRVLRHLGNPVDDCSDRLLEKAGLPWCQLLSTPRSFLTSQIDFQSSPGRRTGCNLGGKHGRESDGVSILPRSSDRMQRDMVMAFSPWSKFQSSPGRRTGCNHVFGEHLPVVVMVSILPRSSDRMQRGRGWNTNGP